MWSWASKRADSFSPRRWPIAWARASSLCASRKSCRPRRQSVSYQLEYGTDTLEIHEDAIRPGQHVLLSDDLLATGGTAAATIKLIRQLGGIVSGAAFAVELTFLNGRAKLPGVDVFSLIQYDK